MVAPIQPDAHRSMKKLAREIDRELNGKAKGDNRRWGFVLLVSEFDKIEDGRVSYISNGERADIIAMLREYLARVEGRYSESVTKPQ